MSEIIFRLLFILAIAIAIFLIGIVAGSIVGRHFKKKAIDEHASNPGAESYRGER